MPKLVGMAAGHTLKRRNPSALVQSSSASHRRWLSRVLRAAGITVGDEHGLGGIGRLEQHDLVVLDSMEGSGALETLFSEYGNQLSDLHVLMIADGVAAYAELFESLSRHGCANLLARNGHVEPTDLIATVKKLYSPDIFGMEKYFAWGVHGVIRELRCSDEIPELCQAAQDFAQMLEIHPRLIDHFSSVAEELATNALYNAPTDTEQRPLFRNTGRDQSVELPDDAICRVQFCCDGTRLGVAVRDPFGSLAPRAALQLIGRCFKDSSPKLDTEGGAGLGLYMAFDAVSHFVINLSPGRCTEAIGLLNVQGVYREFSKRSKSFNIFMA